jgi:hypothetical protein
VRERDIKIGGEGGGNCQRWMRFLGFRNTKLRKGYCTDDHNRKDIITYRDTVFLPQMQTYVDKMQHYEGPEMTTIILPIIPPTVKLGDRRVVMITHDKSTFYSNEGKTMMWMENGKQKLLPKNKGESLMISGFVCDCHGFMSNDLLGDDLIQSYQFLKAV